MTGDPELPNPRLRPNTTIRPFGNPEAPGGIMATVRGSERLAGSDSQTALTSPPVPDAIHTETGG